MNTRGKCGLFRLKTAILYSVLAASLTGCTNGAANSIEGHASSPASTEEWDLNKKHEIDENYEFMSNLKDIFLTEEGDKAQRNLDSIIETLTKETSEQDFEEFRRQVSSIGLTGQNADGPINPNKLDDLGTSLCAQMEVGVIQGHYELLALSDSYRLSHDLSKDEPFLRTLARKNTEGYQLSEVSPIVRRETDATYGRIPSEEQIFQSIGVAREIICPNKE